MMIVGVAFSGRGVSLLHTPLSLDHMLMLMLIWRHTEREKGRLTGNGEKAPIRSTPHSKTHPSKNIDSKTHSCRSFLFTERISFSALKSVRIDRLHL
jgi:hypothetical protein